MTKQNIERICGGIAILILLGWAISLKINNSSLEASIKSYDASIAYLNQKTDSLVNAGGKKVTTQEVVTTPSESFVKDEALNHFDLKKKDAKKVKKVDLFVKADQEFKIEDDMVPFDPPTAEDLTGKIDTANMIIVPQPFHKEDSSYAVYGKVIKTGVQIDSLKARDSIYFMLADIKGGIFSKSKKEISLMHTNNKFSFKGVNSIQVSTKVNAWNRIIKPVLFFIAGAYGTYKLTH